MLNWDEINKKSLYPKLPEKIVYSSFQKELRNPVLAPAKTAQIPQAPLRPQNLRNAPLPTKITPEQQAKNQALALEELQGKHGNIASLARGLSGGLATMGLRTLLPGGTNQAQEEASQKNVALRLPNAPINRQGYRPEGQPKYKDLTYQGIGEFAGSMVGVDPLGLAIGKGAKVIGKLPSKAPTEIPVQAKNVPIQPQKPNLGINTPQEQVFAKKRGLQKEPWQMTKDEYKSYLGFDGKSDSPIPVDAFEKTFDTVGKRVMEKSGKQSIDDLVSYYAQKYNLPPIELKYDLPDTNKALAQALLPKGKGNSATYYINLKSGAKFEPRTVAYIRHEIEHIKDASEGFNPVFTPSKLSPDEFGDAPYSESLTQYFKGHHKSYDWFEPEYMHRSIIKQAIREGNQVPEKVLKDYPGLVDKAAHRGGLPKAQKPEPKPIPKANKEMSVLDRAYQQTVDNQHAISKATKGIPMATDKNPVILASNARNAKGTAEYAIKVGLTDMEGRKVTDYSLEQLLLRPKAEREAYQDYLLHKHNIDRYRQDKPVFGKDITDKMSQKAVADYEAQYPQFKGLRENLTAYNEKVVDEWLVKGGLIDAKLGDILKKMYKNYVPTIREGSVPGKQFKTKGLTPGQVVKEAVGGNKPIMSITKSYPIMVEKAIKSARKNEVYLGLLDAVEKNPDKMARWAKVVEDSAEKKYKDAINVTDATEAIQKNGLDGIEDISNKQLEIDSRNGKYYATAMRQGKPVRMEIHKDLFDALDSLNRIGNEGQLDGMAAAVKKYATNPFKSLITGYNPVFALKNIFRDIPTSYIQGTENNPLKWAANLGRAGKSMLKKDEAYQEFVALGGKKGNFFDTEKGLQIENVPTRLLKGGAEKIGAFNNFTETLPRYGEYLGTVRREGGNYAAKQKGIYNSGEVTVNFARQGDKVKAVDTVVPYLNPAVQGIDRAIRNLRHPLTYAKGALVITAPTTALYMLNQAVDKKAYDQLDNRTKDTNYLIPMGGGQFFKVPKSRESGVLFGSLFERLFRLAEGQQESFKGFNTTLATNFAPSNPIENNLLAPVTLNLATNKDFADRTIVPLSMLNDNRSPYLQYDEQTSEIAKWVGEQSRNLPGLKDGLSPKQIDYLIKSYTGIIGQILQPATTKGGSPFENIIKRGFTADPVYNNEIQNNFYEKFDEAKRIKSDLNINNDIPSDYITPEEKRVSAYNEASLKMSELRKQEKKLIADGATDAKLKQIRQEIINIAERTPTYAESVYEQYKKTYIPELSMMGEKQVATYNGTLKPIGVTPKQYREAYLAQKDFSSGIQKAIALDNAGHYKMYQAFDISENSAMLGEAIKYSGLSQNYSQTYDRLKGVTESEVKKRMIDAANPNLPREQLELLYEAFNVSQAVGKYKRKFND